MPIIDHNFATAMAPEDKVEEVKEVSTDATSGDKVGEEESAAVAHGDDKIDDGEEPDMPDMEAMMGGMGGGDDGDGGMGGMDMNALMEMMGKGGGKGGGMDMASMMGMGGMGGKAAGKGAPEEEVEKKGEKWIWSQKGEEVHVRFPLDPPATNKKDVAVTFKSTSLKVIIRGETIIDGAVGGKVDADDCTWCLSPAKDELQVMLTKVAGKTEAWRDLLA